MDDILLYERRARLIRYLRQVPDNQRQSKTKAKTSTCNFGRASVAFLGHVVSANGIGTERVKIEAIQKWPTP